MEWIVELVVPWSFGDWLRSRGECSYHVSSSIAWDCYCQEREWPSSKGVGCKWSWPAAMGVRYLITTPGYCHTNLNIVGGGGVPILSPSDFCWGFWIFWGGREKMGGVTHFFPMVPSGLWWSYGGSDGAFKGKLLAIEQSPKVEIWIGGGSHRAPMELTSSLN